MYLFIKSSIRPGSGAKPKDQVSLYQKTFGEGGSIHICLQPWYVKFGLICWIRHSRTCLLVHVCKRPDRVCPDWTFISSLFKGFLHVNYLLSLFYAPQKLLKCLLSHVLDYKFSINNKSPPQLFTMLCYHLTSLISVVSHNSHKTKSTFRKSGFYSAFRLKQLFMKSQLTLNSQPTDGPLNENQRANSYLSNLPPLQWMEFDFTTLPIIFYTFGPLLVNELTCWPHMIWDPQVGGSGGPKSRLETKVDWTSVYFGGTRGDEAGRVIRFFS